MNGARKPPVAYRGVNAVGQALAADADGSFLEALLEAFDGYAAAVRDKAGASSTPANHRRSLAAAECAADCALVVKEFHAVCAGTCEGQAR